MPLRSQLLVTAPQVEESVASLASGNAITVVMMRTTHSRCNAYSELSDRANWVRHELIRDVMGELRMSPIDVLAAFLKSVPKFRDELKGNLPEPGGELKRLLRNTGITVPIEVTPAAALLMEQHVTESRTQVLRSYFGARIPSFKKLGEAKHEFLQRMPDILVLHQGWFSIL